MKAWMGVFALEPVPLQGEGTGLRSPGTKAIILTAAD